MQQNYFHVLNKTNKTKKLQNNRKYIVQKHQQNKNKSQIIKTTKTIKTVKTTETKKLQNNRKEIAKRRISINTTKTRTTKQKGRENWREQNKKYKFSLQCISFSRCPIFINYFFVTLIFILSTTLANSTNETDRINAGRLAFTLFGTIELLDVAISVLCMYMHYQFGNSLYEKLCIKCHIGLKEKWDQKAENKMTERAIRLSVCNKKVIDEDGTATKTDAL